MNISSINSEKIFEEFPMVQKAGRTLVRLAKLDNSLPSNQIQRQQQLSILTSIWTEAEMELAKSFDAAREKSIQGLELLGKSFRNIYEPELNLACTADELKKCMHRYLKDISTILIPPIRKSKRGNKGPTFLVDYKRLSLASSKIRSHQFVLKWTNREELACQRIYSAFSNGFRPVTMGVPSAGFLIPTASGFNPGRKQYEKSSGEQLSLSSSDCLDLHKKFLEISRIYNSRQTPTAPCLMIAQRVEGENLFDFALSRYRHLTRGQKEKLFNRLGRLAMLDMLMGNLDRLVQIFTMKGKYCLQDLEANLGNVMVVWPKGSEDPPILYAIDNGIDSDLIDNPVARNNYLDFLKTFFSSHEWKKDVANNLIASFKHALITQIDDVSDGNIQELKSQLTAFSNDLDLFAHQAFLQGIEEMVFTLQESLIPEWESKNAQSLKKYLKTSYPEILGAIQERIDIFKTARSSWSLH